MSSVVEPAAGASPAGVPTVAGSRPRRLALVVSLLAGIGLIVTFLTVKVGEPVRSADTPVVGRAAPAFDLDTLDGGRLSLAELRGSPVVLNFWASWCIPCREEAPLLTDLDRRLGPRGLRVLGVVYQDSDESARDFMDRYGQSYPGLLDRDGRTAIDYGVFGIPETFFIDGSGIVRSRQIGALTADDLERQVGAILP